jgi:hypothetical protein
MEEGRDPGLKVERAIAKYEARGMSRAWSETRFQTIQFRRGLSEPLAERGGSGFAEMAISDIADTVVFGMTAAEFRFEPGLPQRAHTSHRPKRRVWGAADAL